MRYNWSAVIATKNEEDRIEKTIRSVLNQVVPPKYIVVVDDGSMNGTVRIVEQFSEVVRVIRLKDRGYSGIGRPELAIVFNKGFEFLEKKEMDFVLVVGADNVYNEDYVEKLVWEFIKNNFRLAMTSGYPKIDPVSKNHVSGGGRLINTEFFRRIGFHYPLIYGWESAVILEARRLGYICYSIDEYFNITRRGGTNYKSYMVWGRGMKALGYRHLFVWRRTIECFIKRKFRMGIQLAAGFYSFAPNKLASKELRKFTKNYQMEKLIEKIKQKTSLDKLLRKFFPNFYYGEYKYGR
jgi:glycosyltransferase involved in cell wall biosynthesis